MELNDSDDLIKFVAKETKKISDLDLTYAYKILCRSFPKIIVTLYRSSYSITSINPIDIIISGCDMLHNIFWFILRHTNNCEVALFLAETSIKLFIDSLTTSYETLQDHPFKLAPNISDSIRYAYKKTIGPLSSSFSPNFDIDNLQMASLIIKMIVVQTMKQIIYAGLLPNNCRNKPIDTSIELKSDTMPPKLDVLIEFVQQHLKI